jgi:hypothetical protein
MQIRAGVGVVGAGNNERETVDHCGQTQQRCQQRRRVRPGQQAPKRQATPVAAPAFRARAGLNRHLSERVDPVNVYEQDCVDGLKGRQVGAMPNESTHIIVAMMFDK